MRVAARVGGAAVGVDRRHDQHRHLAQQVHDRRVGAERELAGHREARLAAQASLPCTLQLMRPTACWRSPRGSPSASGSRRRECSPARSVCVSVRASTTTHIRSLAASSAVVYCSSSTSVGVRARWPSCLIRSCSHAVRSDAPGPVPQWPCVVPTTRLRVRLRTSPCPAAPARATGSGRRACSRTPRTTDCHRFDLADRLPQTDDRRRADRRVIGVDRLCARSGSRWRSAPGST